jgi:hypothetical protein
MERSDHEASARRGFPAAMQRHVASHSLRSVRKRLENFSSRFSFVPATFLFVPPVDISD